MSEYEIGKDIQKLIQRLDALESTLNSKQIQLDVPRVIKGLPSVNVPEFVFDNIITDERTSTREQEGEQVNILAVNWLPPFPSRNTWRSNSSGNIYVHHNEIANKDNGAIKTYLGASKNNTDDSDKAERYSEAYFGFGYRNPYKSGKLRVKAEFFINSANMKASLEDEFGVSGVNISMFSRLSIDCYKKIGNEYVNFGRDNTNLLLPIKQRHSGIGRRTYEESDSNKAKTVFYKSDNDLEINQRANIFVGVWCGLFIWANDYSFRTNNNSDIRLDKVEAWVE